MITKKNRKNQEIHIDQNISSYKTRHLPGCVC